MNVRTLTFPALIVLNGALIFGLARQWVGSDGKPVSMSWQAPVATVPDLTGLDVVLTGSPEIDLQRFARLQERPLFSPTRRPPPPLVPPAPPPPPDPLEKVHVFGTYIQEGGGGGVLLQVEGKVRRIALGARVGQWTVKSVTDRGVQVQRGTQTRMLSIKQVPGVKTAPPASSPTRAAGSQGRNVAGAAASRRGSSAPSETATQEGSADEAGAAVQPDDQTSGAAVTPATAPAPSGAAATTAEERRAARLKRINERRAARELAPPPQ